jgi:Transposase DDE domain/Transposase domain (DUF772)
VQLTLRQQITKFAHMLQSELFPALEQEGPAFTEAHKRLIAALAMVPLRRFVPCAGNWRGRRQKDRLAIASAFLAKSVLNLATTRQLLERLAADSRLRQLCGWEYPHQIPHEATFSRAFAEFAEMKLAEITHETLIRETHQERLVGHIARDSSAIRAWERFPETPSQKRAQQAQSKAKKPRYSAKGRKLGRKVRKTKPTPGSRDTRIERQKTMTVEQMLGEIPRPCSIGVKLNSRRQPKYWIGYKLHLDVADGQIPVTALLSSANVHDSQLSVPLSTISSQRVTYLYEIMDSAYDAVSLREYSRQLGHVPIIDPKAPQNQTTQLPSRRKLARQLTPAETLRYRERTMVERVYSRLKNEFGATSIRVRGANKVMAHLMFGVLALTADQLLKLGG